MTRDIGQILALLQQQNSNLIDAQQKQWNTPILEVPILGQQQQQRTGLDPSELRKPTSLTIETGSRSSCSLPTVNESAAETSSRLLYPKSLSTQRSLDSARYTCLLRVFTRVPNFQTFFFFSLRSRPGGESLTGRTKKTAFRNLPWLPPQARALTYDPSSQTFGNLIHLLLLLSRIVL